MSTGSSGPFDVLVVGAGQAALALGWHLRQQAAHFVMVDACPRVGDVWRSRWDSLHLFTPAEYDALPGMPFPARAGTYPGKEEVAGYLEDYAEAFDLPVRLATRVSRLRRTDAGFTACTTTGDITARQVVVATGPFSVPFIPRWATDLSPGVVQRHSSAYHRPADVPDGSVLVVGAGNSGFQIAEELAAAGRRVTLAVGSRPVMVPQRPLGRDLFWWAELLRLVEHPAESRLGRRMQRGREQVLGTSWRAVRARGITVRSRALGATGSMVAFADGSSVDVDAVVWATGYRPDYTWIDVAGAVQNGRVLHDGGISVVPDLYFLGMPWQRSRGSSLLGFVKQDAAWLSERLAPVGSRRSPAAEPVAGAG